MRSRSNKRCSIYHGNLFRFLQIAALLVLLVIAGLPCHAFAVERIRLATTTSTEASGLLRVLLPPFEESCQCRVDVIAVGTGKALKLGEFGDVDVVLVHARSLEDAFMASGYGSERRDVMSNDFVVLGPSQDPAAVLGSSDLVEALNKIARSGAFFISRGDDSGTHVRERELWQAAGLTPEGRWYLEAGRGMGEVLIMASERQGYTLSDRGTYLAFKDKVELQVVFSGDQRMINPYGVMMVNPVRHPHVKVDLSRSFIDFLISDQGQAIISNFNIADEQLFFTH